MVSAEQESLRRFLRGLCGGDGSCADDIAQEALLKAYLSFERFEGRASFSTWIFRIAYNCFYDHIQRSGRNIATSMDNLPEVFSISDDSYRSDHTFRYQHLYYAISTLRFQEQAVLLLFYMEEKSIKEISSIMGMPSGTIRSCLSRGRKHLKEYLNRIYEH